jgi:hypothetical protein
MTEYKDLVETERARLQQEEEINKWAKGIKYIHANNGVVETKFNNGDIEYSRDGRISWHREKPTKQKLLNRFQRAMADITKRKYWET